MSMHVHAENFQSWESFDLPIDKLTVVIGNSNLGKSASIRAIRALIRNEAEAGQVREVDGKLADSLSITLKAEDKTFTLTRKKGTNGSAVVMVDDQEFAKLGGNVPEPIQNLNMGEVRIGEVVLDPIFAGQFDQPFILTEKPTALNAIMGAFSSTERLEAGKRAAIKDIAIKKAQAANLAEELQVSEARIFALTPLAEQANTLIADLQRLLKDDAEDQALLSLFEEAIRLRQERQRVVSVLAQINLPDFSEIDADAALIGLLDDALAARQEHVAITLALDSVSLPDLASLESDLQTVNLLDELLADRRQHARLMQTLGKVVIPDVGAIEDDIALVRDIDALLLARKEQRSGQACLDTIQDMLETWGALTSDYQEWKLICQVIELREAEKSSPIPRVTETLKEVAEQHRALANDLELVGLLDSAIALRRELAEVSHDLAEVSAEATLIEAKIAELKSQESEAMQSAGLVLCTHCGKPTSIKGAK